MCSICECNRGCVCTCVFGLEEEEEEGITVAFRGGRRLGPKKMATRRAGQASPTPPSSPAPPPSSPAAPLRLCEAPLRTSAPRGGPQPERLRNPVITESRCAGEAGRVPTQDGSHVSLLFSCLPSDMVVKWYQVKEGGRGYCNLQQEQLQPTVRNAINQAH